MKIIVDLFMLLLPSGFRFQVSGVRIKGFGLNLKPLICYSPLNPSLDPRHFVAKLDRNHRLDVADINRPVLGAGAEVKIILWRHTDQVSHGVLGLFHQFFFAGLLRAGLWSLRGLTRYRCQQENNNQ